MKQIGALQFEIPPNAPYSFSGLNTEHPVLSIGDKLKLIGEYQETVRTCLIFEEEGRASAQRYPNLKRLVITFSQVEYK
ncbi:hypothetical protein ACFX1T_007563 [Malus domestica]